jgi:hypothetical protein
MKVIPFTLGVNMNLIYYQNPLSFMSMIALKDPKLVEMYNQFRREDEQDRQNRLAELGVLFLNGPNICVVCSKGPTFDEYERTISLQKHHVSYFPQKIAHVHKQCHDEIHATDNHVLIQYDEGDSKKFYDNLKALSKNSSGGMYQ